MDDLTRLRDAFDTLGIDPAEIQAADSYGAELDLIVQLRDAAARLAEGELRPVTEHTPPGTEIWHPDYSADGKRRWFVGLKRRRSIPEYFAYEVEHSVQVALSNYGRWVEVARPDPVPVKVGQWRAMPVRVAQVRSVDHCDIALPDGKTFYAVESQGVESWPVIPPPEGTDD